MEKQIVGLLVWQHKISPDRYLQLLRDCPDPARLLAQPELAGAIPRLEAVLRSSANVKTAGEWLARWANAGIRATVLGDAAYPVRLAAIHNPPPILFYRGTLSPRLNDGVMVSVVGARSADSETCRIAYDLSRRVAEAGGCVISGLAYGVDSHAHSGALDSGADFPTVAILGGGLERIYPAAHTSLAKRIEASGGLIITQFGPDAAAYPANFLDRNRVVAGLSDAVIVIQAAKRSGSLSTARYALEEGRDVLAIPGAFSDARFAGSNNLLKQGAYLVTDFDDICAVVDGLKPPGKAGAASAVEPDNPGAAEIVSCLRKGGRMHYTQLEERFGSLDDFDRLLLERELDGLVLRLPGNYVAAASQI